MTTDSNVTTLQAGSLAIWDSLTAGLVPCRIVSIDGYPGHKCILLTVTAKRGSYERGRLVDTNASRVLPRNIRRVRGSYGQRIIIPPHRFLVTRGEGVGDV